MHKKSQANFQASTFNPFYNDTRYKDKIRYNDNFTGTNPLLKR